MESGLLCLLTTVLLVACVGLAAVLAAVGERVGRLDRRLTTLSGALDAERAQGVALAAEVARHRSEIAGLALRGEALRQTEPERVGPGVPNTASDEEVEAAVRSAAAAASPDPGQAAVGGLKPVRRTPDGSPAHIRPPVRPIVTPRKLGVDDLKESDIRNALGDTVRPPGQPARPAPPPPGLSAPPPPHRTAGPSIETLVVWFAASLAGLLFVVAALFGLGKLIEAGWLGPSARFTGAVLLALSLWMFSGLLRWRKFDIPANALAGSGTAIAYGAVYAGHAVYGFLGQPVAMGSMVTITAISMFAAARKNAGLWAFIAAIGGYATPILLSTGDNQPVGFFSYLFLLNAGILFAARRQGWWWLIAIAGSITACLHLGWGFTFRAPDQAPVALAASFLLGAWFFGAARPGGSTPTRAAAFYGGVALLVAGMPFLVPADPLQYDPRSRLPLTWTMGVSAELGAAWLVAITALLSQFTPTGDKAAPAAVRWLASAVMAVGVATFGAGWMFAAEPRWSTIVLGTAAVLVLSTLAGRIRGSELGAGPLVAAAGILALGLAAAPPPAAWMLGLSLATSGAALWVAVGRDRDAPVAAVLASAPLAVRLSERVPPFLPEGGYTLLAAVIAYQVFAVVLAFRLRPGRPGTAAAVVLSGPIAFWSFHTLWQAGLGRGEGALALIMAGFLMLAARIARVNGVEGSSGQFAALLIAILGFVALAIPLQFDNAWLTVGWALEVAALAGLSRRYAHPGIKGTMALLAVIVAARLLLNPYALQYGDGSGWILLNWTLYTWGVPAVAFLVAAALLPGMGPAADLGKRALRVTATFILFALINLEVAHAFAHDNELSFTSENLVESMTRSLSWGLFGLAVMAVGLWRDSRSARLFGFGFALLAAAKVCLVDVVALAGWIRVGSLFGLGIVMLIASVFFMRVVLSDRKKAALAAGAPHSKDGR
ncbi:MAG: DUF2339 domain-containing protein [Myxococcales bacterium]|nr:DUF2339 domain-containing protein [Myxococcales bacterium]